MASIGEESAHNEATVQGEQDVAEGLEETIYILGPEVVYTGPMVNIGVRG